MPTFLREVLSFTLASSALLALPACGSDVSTGGSGGNGGSGTGGTGSGSAGTGGTGGGPVGCPLSEPVVGTPCALPADQSCIYGTCCPPLYRCNEGVWQVLLPPCVPPAPCPSTPPATGDACNVCFQDSPCTYDRCGTGQGIITATCTETGSWFAETTTCPPPPD
jgi:hypothetical protein